MVNKWCSSKTTCKSLTEEPIIRQVDKRKEKKKKNFIENTPVLIGWEKIRNIVKNIKLNETAKNVEC